MRAMTDRPILFSPAMVRALLDGRKTQTRRVLKPAWQEALDGHDEVLTWFAPQHVPAQGIPNQWAQSGIWARKHGQRGYNRHLGYAPYRPGDRLYVREAHYRFGHWEPVQGIKTKSGRQKWQFVEDRSEVLFDAPPGFRKGRHNQDPSTPAWHIRLGRTMFRYHSRLTLAVTDVRVQRLQEISEADAVAEGAITPSKVGPHYTAFDAPFGQKRMGLSAYDIYRSIWDSLNAERGFGWASNPWIVAISFTVEHRNIDAGRA